MAKLEEREQALLVEWLRLLGWTPQASLNGVRLTGNRVQRARRWAKLASLGALTGACDLMVLEPAPVDGRHVGIEMKRQATKANRRGVVSESQRDVHEIMAASGWHVIVAYGYEDAQRQLIDLGYGRFKADVYK